MCFYKYMCVLPLLYLCSGSSSTHPVSVVFQAPSYVLFSGNTRLANYSHSSSYDPPWDNWPAQQAPDNMTEVPSYGAGIVATNASLLVDGQLSMLGNKPGALLLQSSTATFTRIVSARNNADNKGQQVIKDSTATFQNLFVCNQDSKQHGLPNEPPLPPVVHTTTCIRVERSALQFDSTVIARNGLQAPCDGYAVPCESRGGAAISCEDSSIKFKGRAQFSGNVYVAANGWGTVEPAEELGGGAWRLRSCNVVAEKWVGFRGNAAGWKGYQDLSGGAVRAVNSSMLFQDGLELTGTNASRGGGVWLNGSKMKLSGGRLVCKGNVANTQDGSCVELMGNSHWDHP
jgi:hypothetical protein